MSLEKVHVVVNQGSGINTSATMKPRSQPARAMEKSGQIRKVSVCYGGGACVMKPVPIGLALKPQEILEITDVCFAAKIAPDCICQGADTLPLQRKP